MCCFGRFWLNKMSKLADLEKEVTELKQRNKRVEADKAWETSWTRIFIIFVLTYGAIAVYFYAAGLPKPLINSVVPSVAFVISVLTLPFFKRLWLGYHRK